MSLNLKIHKKEKKPCLMMPPPNVTGSLHMGHASLLLHFKIF